MGIAGVRIGGEGVGRVPKITEINLNEGVGFVLVAFIKIVLR